MMLKDQTKLAVKIAFSIQQTAQELNLTPISVRASADIECDEIRMFDMLVTEPKWRLTTRELFFNGHYALAVEEAHKCLNNEVKSRSKNTTADGAGLMKTVFSLNNPILKINELRTRSQQDQQLGYMEILAGCMTGIRNPRAHEHKYLDEPNTALELLVLANHLMEIVSNAKRVRRRRR